MHTSGQVSLINAHQCTSFLSQCTQIHRSYRALSSTEVHPHFTNCIFFAYADLKGLVQYFTGSTTVQNNYIAVTFTNDTTDAGITASTCGKGAQLSTLITEEKAFFEECRTVIAENNFTTT